MELNEIKVLGIGVATMDMYVDRGRMYPGGNEYNVACNAVYLGAKAGFLGVFAYDKAGEILEETLQKVGVDVSMCHHEEGTSGYSLVKLKEDGDRVFLFWNREGVTDLYPITFTEEEMAYIKGFDVVCFGRCAYIDLKYIRKLYEAGVTICYDFHSTFDEEEVKRIAPFVKYAFFSTSHLNEEETKKYLKSAVACGCSIAVGTKGADPVYACDQEQFYKYEIVPVEVKDALGAGDSYIAAFLVNYLKNQDRMTQPEAIRQSLMEASSYSAHVVQIEGGVGVGLDLDVDHIDELV